MAKVTKQSIVETLKGFLVNATKEVKDVIEYVVKSYEENPRNATMAELKETLSIVKDMIIVQPSLVPMENSLKAKNVTNKKIVVTEEADKEKVLPTKKKHTKEEEEKALKELEASINDEEVAVDKTKKLLPKKDKKEDVPKNDAPKEKEEIKKVIPKKVLLQPQKVLTFPESFVSNLGNLKIRPDIKSIKELHDLIEEEVQLVICAYWSKRDLKQYDYDPMNVNLGSKFIKDGFTDDLDIQDITYASENGIVASTVSLYTEVPFIYTIGGFETDEDGMRYMNGVEYQIYEIVE